MSRDTTIFSCYKNVDLPGVSTCCNHIILITATVVYRRALQSPSQSDWSDCIVFELDCIVLESDGLFSLSVVLSSSFVRTGRFYCSIEDFYQDETF